MAKETVKMLARLLKIRLLAVILTKISAAMAKLEVLGVFFGWVTRVCVRFFVWLPVVFALFLPPANGRKILSLAYDDKFTSSPHGHRLQKAYFG